MATARRRQQAIVEVSHESFDEVVAAIEAAQIDREVETEDGSAMIDMTSIRLVRRAAMTKRAAMDLAEFDTNAVTVATNLLDDTVKLMEAQADEFGPEEYGRLVANAVNAFNAIAGQRILTEQDGYTFMTMLETTRMMHARAYHHETGQAGVMYFARAAEAKSRQG